MTYPVDYEAAAALIPTPAFGPLCHAADKLPVDDDEPTLQSLRWCAGTRFEFIPGDATLYDVVMVRLSENEILVSLLNLDRTTAILPFGYDQPAVTFYVADKLRLTNDCTVAAICALVNRAAGAVVQLAEINKAAEEAAAKIVGQFIVVVRHDPEDVEAAERTFRVSPEGTTSEISPETLKAMFDAESEDD